MSWIKRYLEYTDSHEAPEAYHFWVGLATIAGALERGVWFDADLVAEHFTVYPNMYLILLGRSGMRKSSAIREGVQLLNKVPGRTIVEEKITYAQLLVDMAKTGRISPETGEVETGSCVTINAPELTVFIGRDAYASGAIAGLTSLYDCPDKWPYRTKHGGQYCLYNPCVNLIGGTTATGFRDVVPSDAAGLGFSSRLFVVSEEKLRSRPLFQGQAVLKKRRALRDELVRGLIKISQMRGPMSISEKGMEFLEEWYQNKPPSYDERLESFESKQHAMAIKIGMLLSASDNERMVLQHEDVKYALMALEALKGKMRTAYEHVGDHEYVSHMYRVLRQISSRGKVSWRQLLQLNFHHLTREGLRQVMDHLVEGGHVLPVSGERGGRWYKAVDSVEED